MLARCACGSVEIEGLGRPIATVACYCDDCHTARCEIEALPSAVPIADSDGGTGYIVFRKDRVRCTRGTHHLKAFKIRAESPTSRYVATCCNSAVMLGFDDGKWWIDLYRSRVVGDTPLLQMRVCRKPAPDRSADSDSVPSFPSYPARFIARLLWAKICTVCG